MTELIHDFAGSFEQLGSWAYLVAFVAVYLESLVVVGQFFPGVIFITFLGFLCYIQVYALGPMLIAMFLGHYFGEMTNYFLGRTRGRALFSEGSRFLKPSLLARAERHFQGGGASYIIAGQFVGVVRPVVSFAAGVAHYPIGRYLAVSAVADFIWAVVYLGFGYLFGASWERAARYIERFSVALFVGVAAVWFSVWLIRTLMAHADEMWTAIDLAGRRIQRSVRYRHLAERHPRLFAFMEARLDPGRRWGLHASVGWVVAFVLAAYFVNVMLDLKLEPARRHLDLALVNLLAQMRSPLADQFFLFITLIGNLLTVLAIVALTAVFCLHARQLRSLALVAGSVALALTFSEWMKAFNLRVRPEATLALIQVGGYSFPSGHATLSVATFGSLYWWLWHHPGRFRLRVLLAMVVVALILLIGFSRIYLGVHFPSDVVGGLALGLACVVFCGTLVLNLQILPESDRRADWAALAVVLMGLAVAGGLFARRPAAPPMQVIRPGPPIVAAASLEALRPRLPREAHNLTDAPSLPINVVVIGDPAPLAARLEGHDWSPVNPGAFFTRQVRRPVFPAFIRGVPARITLQRAGEGERQILRLWRTEHALGGKEVWVGSAVVEKEERHVFGLTDFNLSPDLDEATARLAEAARGSGRQRLIDFRTRNLYRWRHPFFTHGEALLMDEVGE